MGKTTIRPATVDDLDLLMEIAVAMHAESPRYSKLALSLTKMLNLFVFLMDNPDGLLIVAERDGAVIGGVAGMVAQHWFSEELIAQEYAVFLLPEHRGGMAAARLVKEFIAWGQSKGAKMIQLGISTGVHVEETAALYRALGLKQFSYGFEV